ncbi:hypothetical protein H9Y05_08315 [Crocinitomicaceae bacterium CZZ-1]|uniref:Uncharacterized protein n=1 Tax=Taishania pollutisoli TaxID=2766479 RepID=A0A8J6U290_9FLAO|nr:hypothetical protein [Taishania pollutisoli]MBC9812475.1 hypothetical protein [Taishania pollutisoli]MBX2949368.1 hypothetical protein [Crocinitomicaceae bacterium]
MSWSNGTLFLLKEKQNPKDFVTELIERLKTIGWKLALSEESVCFNDSVSGEEKESVYFEEETSEEEIIDLLVSWKGLGMLVFFVPEFEFPVVVDFISWDDVSLGGFTVECNGKDNLFFSAPEKHKSIIYKIAEFARFKLVVGDVENYSVHYNLSAILEKAKENHFEILLTNIN